MRSAEHFLFGRRLRVAGLMLSATLLLAACGGGGGGGGGGSATTTPTTPTTPVVSSPATTTPAGSNVVPLVVDTGPAGAGRIANVPYATVTICPPGSTSGCQTIDRVLVDTGSTGLRVFASALTSTAPFPAVTNSASVPYAQCATFINSYTWGSVRSADVALGGLTASALPIQVMADPAYPGVPAACSRTGTSQNSAALLGANGILGISGFVQDCGSACVGTAISAAYYTCSGGSTGTCTPSAVPLAQQVTNPIARLPSDNNGSMIQFPAVASAGQATATGSLVLGIGTRSNNAVGSATAYAVNGSTGYLTTTYNGRVYNQSAFDSGSNFYFFNDAAIATCSASGGTGSGTTSLYYCPAGTLTLSATVTGTNAAGTTVSFSIANATSMFNNTNAVIPNVGATIGSNSVFLWGLPFFYGRSVFTAIQGQATPLGTGPYVGF